MKRIYLMIACTWGNIRLVRSDCINDRCFQCAQRIRASRYTNIVPNKRIRDKLMRVISDSTRRCNNKQHSAFSYYGERGITVHNRWTTNRMAYLLYLITLPGWDNPNLTLDRIDNNGNYEPGNLRFATQSQQQRNKRTYKRRWQKKP